MLHVLFSVTECANKFSPLVINQTGTLKFPANGSYNNCMDCTWLIQAPANKVKISNL